MALEHLSFANIGVLVLLVAGSCLGQREHATDGRVEQRQIRQSQFITCPGLYNQRSEDPSDCAYFYLCKNNRVIRQRCPIGQMFSPTQGTCGYAAPSWCRSRALVQYPTHMDYAPTFQCTQAGGRFQDRRDCSSYYQCTNWNAQRLACPTGQLFDPTRGLCGYINYPGNCDMSTGWRPNGGSVWLGQLTTPFQCTQASGRFQDSRDCSSYYVCTNWNAQRLTCPSGQLFDPTRGFCGNINYPGNCDMSTGLRPGSGISWGGQTSSSYQCTQESGRIQDTSDCSRYYVCTNWIGQRMSCPSGQLFDPNTRSCGNINRPRDCQLPTGWRPVTGSGWTSQSSNTYTCPEARGEFPYPPDCSRFLRCDNFTAVVMNCPGKLLFNADRRYCDWPENLVDNRRCTPPAGRENQLLNLTSGRYYY